MSDSNNLREIDSRSVEDLERLINEHSSEHQLILQSFKKSMSLFATERSMDTCLESLNLSIQLSSTRSALMELYKSYSRILEKEIIRLRKICPDNDH